MEREFGLVFRTHAEPMRRSLTRQFGDPALAADLVQEAFLRLMQAAPAMAVRDVPGYLARIARNLGLNHVRQRRQRRTDAESPAGLGHLPSHDPAADRALDARHRLHRLQAALATLPERTQLVFQLTRLEHLTYRETAERLGISESAVQKHLTRALMCAMQEARAWDEESRPGDYDTASG